MQCVPCKTQEFIQPKSSTPNEADGVQEDDEGTSLTQSSDLAATGDSDEDAVGGSVLGGSILDDLLGVPSKPLPPPTTARRSHATPRSRSPLKAQASSTSRGSGKGVSGTTAARGTPSSGGKCRGKGARIPLGVEEQLKFEGYPKLHEETMAIIARANRSPFLLLSKTHGKRVGQRQVCGQLATDLDPCSTT